MACIYCLLDFLTCKIIYCRSLLIFIFIKVYIFSIKGDRNVVDDSPKRQCLNPSESDEKENSFVPSSVSSNVRGLAALRKQYNNPGWVILMTQVDFL